LRPIHDSRISVELHFRKALVGRKLVKMAITAPVRGAFGELLRISAEEAKTIL
jgi:hypothetical protein